MKSIIMNYMELLTIIIIIITPTWKDPAPDCFEESQMWGREEANQGQVEGWAGLKSMDLYWHQPAQLIYRNKNSKQWILRQREGNRFAWNVDEGSFTQFPSVRITSSRRWDFPRAGEVSGIYPCKKRQAQGRGSSDERSHECDHLGGSTIQVRAGTREAERLQVQIPVRLLTGCEAVCIPLYASIACSVKWRLCGVVVRIPWAVLLAQWLPRGKGSIKATQKLSGERAGWQGGKEGLFSSLLLRTLN